MKKIGYAFFTALARIFLVSLLFSCDILRQSPFEVAQWSPGTGYHGTPERIRVSVSFSHDPDTLSVEHSFSLTEDGSSVNGSFGWSGRTLVFTPAVPLELNRDYVITIREDAQDQKGISLDEQFEAPFTTRGMGKRPVVLSVDPQDMGTVLDPWQEIRMEFSEPPRVTSCVNAVSFSPSSGGSWRLEAGGYRAVFAPQEPWVMGTTYRIRVAPDFSSSLGLTLGKEFTTYFTVGNDQTPPRLTAARALDPEGAAVMELVPAGDGPLLGENPRWESAYRLGLEFSEPVDTADLRNRLVVEKALPLEMETESGYADRVVFSFSKKPEYLSSFLIRINAGVKDKAGNESTDPVSFRIRADGPYSKPPALAGIRLPMAPGGLGDETTGNPLPPEQYYQAAAFSVDEPFQDLPILPGTGRYPYTESTPTWIELYFDRAPGAEIDLLSLMNLFRVDATHNALSFFPRSMEAGNFSVPTPPPGWEAYYRINVKGFLINTTDPGVVVFQIASGLQDNLGNRNEKVFRLPLLK
ncbi:Ig-like domain-containing protein [Treponema sp. TIM-1]|uniref:Ig-like domain-containing protein n=1 Tax=Treponema sp. TIM-1 TaxID=2898417 RepID=UPI003980181B